MNPQSKISTVAQVPLNQAQPLNLSLRSNSPTTQKLADTKKGSKSAKRTSKWRKKLSSARPISLAWTAPMAIDVPSHTEPMNLRQKLWFPKIIKQTTVFNTSRTMCAIMELDVSSNTRAITLRMFPRSRPTMTWCLMGWMQNLNWQQKVAMKSMFLIS